jgi:hypothetical protein
LSECSSARALVNPEKTTSDSEAGAEKPSGRLKVKPLLILAVDVKTSPLNDGSSIATFHRTEVKKHHQSPTAEAGPEQPPELESQDGLWKSQWPRMLVLFVIPLLALAGVFDSGRKVAHSKGENAEIQIRYPRAARYGRTVDVEIVMREIERPPAKIEVRIPTSYLRLFSMVSVTPAPVAVRENYIIDVPVPEPGGETRVILELEAGKAGRARGKVRVLFDAELAAEVPLNTFILP